MRAELASLGSRGEVCEAGAWLTCVGGGVRAEEWAGGCMGGALSVCPYLPLSQTHRYGWSLPQVHAQSTQQMATPSFRVMGGRELPERPGHLLITWFPLPTVRSTFLDGRQDLWVV